MPTFAGLKFKNILNKNKMRKTIRITCMLAFLFLGMMQAKADDPIRKGNALKAEQLTNGKIVLFKGVGNNNTKWINWQNLSTEKPEARCLFLIEYVNESDKEQGFRLKRLTDNKYIGGTKTNNSNIEFKDNQSDATIFIIDPNATTGENLTLPTGATKEELYHLRYKVKDGAAMYLNVQDGRNNTQSTPKYMNGTGSWSFVATFDAALYAKDMLNNYKASEYKIGEGVGEFSDSAGNFTTAQQTAATALQGLQSGSPSVENIKSALTVAPTLETAINQLTIKLPQPGYYRLKNAQNNNYISSNSQSTGRPLMTAEASDAVFFLSGDSKLVSKNLFCLNNYNLEAGLGVATEFKASKGKIGCYAIKNAGAYFAGMATGAQLDHHTNEQNGLTLLECAWTLEPVTDYTGSITKNMSGTEYATISSPVALTIPEGVEAYKVTVSQGNKAASLVKLSKDILPAGVGALLKKTGGNGTFTFNFSEHTGDAGAANTDNNLKPLYENKVFAANSNAVYILAKEGNDYGFFLLWQEGNEEDRTVAAHKAYLELPVAPANALRSIMIGGTTTGINSIETGEAENEVYFDLQGRRVNNPKKGLYITSKGKKVIFN